jgi:hypothetical protein
MSSDRWIVVPNWDKFQHYKDRDPPWIKLYRDLLHKDEWLDLPLAARGLLTGIWLAYAEWNGRLRVSDLRTVMGHTRDTHGTLQRLVDAGFVEVRASTRQTDSVATQQTETDTPCGVPAEQTPENPLAARLLREIRDADTRTAQAVRRFQHRLPDAAFAAALESLRHRRQRGDRAPLVSEARYVVATLSTMDKEQQYAR